MSESKNVVPCAAAANALETAEMAFSMYAESLKKAVDALSPRRYDQATSPEEAKVIDTLREMSSNAAIGSFMLTLLGAMWRDTSEERRDEAN